MKADIILEADQVSYRYPDGTPALKKICIQIPKGKKTVLLGANGAGKSTLFLNFNGILKPREGVVRFDGNDIQYDKKGLLDLRKKVGIVFQDPDSQLFSASVYQEVSFGPLNFGIPEPRVREIVEETLLKLGIGSLRDKPTHMLSYGQKKLVTIAGIMAMEPEVLICDEPTAGLDPGNNKRIVELFDRINTEGTTVIFSTHDIDLAFSWADHIIVIKGGQVLVQGTPDKVFSEELYIRDSCLDRPWMVEVYEALEKKGVLPLDGSLPRTRDEMIERITQGMG